MKALKSLLSISLLTGLLSLNLSCRPEEVMVGAMFGSAALNTLAQPRVVYVAPAPVYIAPIYVQPVPIFIAPQPIFFVPGGIPMRPRVCGPFGCASLNGKDLTSSELVALGSQKYGIEQAAMEKLVAALTQAQSGDLQTAAAGMGLTSNMLAEARSGGISRESADQIASAIGATSASVKALVLDLNHNLQSPKENQLLPPNFEKCDNCG